MKLSSAHQEISTSFHCISSSNSSSRTIPNQSFIARTPSHILSTCSTCRCRCRPLSTIFVCFVLLGRIARFKIIFSVRQQREGERERRTLITRSTSSRKVHHSLFTTTTARRSSTAVHLQSTHTHTTALSLRSSARQQPPSFAVSTLSLSSLLEAPN